MKTTDVIIGHKKYEKRGIIYFIEPIIGVSKGVSRDNVKVIY